MNFRLQSDKHPWTMWNYSHHLFQRCLTTFWEITRIIVPIMILVHIAESFGLIGQLSPVLQPVMAVLNLPPEAAIVCLTSILTGLYGAIATLPLLAGYELTAAQITALCTIMLIAHSLPVEQAIVRRAGGSFWGSAGLRLFSAFVAALLIDVASQSIGFLSQTQNMAYLNEFAQQSSSHWDWVVANLKGLAAIFLILAGLFVMMDAFKQLGIIALIERLLSPIMRLSGLDSSVTSMTTIGALLGLTYGSGLILDQNNHATIDPKAKYYALSWLCLCHSLIEDVALMVLVGGNFWVLFFGRLVFTIVMIRLLMLFHWSIAQGHWRHLVR